MSDLRAKLTLTLDDRLSRAARAALGSLGDEAGRAKAPVYQLDGALDKLMRKKSDPGALLRGAGNEAFKAQAKVRGLAGAVAAFNAKIEAGHKKLFAFREAAGALDDAAGTLHGMSDGIFSAVGGAKDAAVGFDKAFTDISVKSGFAGKDLEDLRLKTMSLGEEFGVLPSEVAKGIDVLAAAGWTKELKGDALRDMMLTAKLGFSDFNTTATVGTGILAVYGSTQTDATKKAAENKEMMLQLANAVNASKISMEDLNYGLQDNMTIAKQAGVAYTDLLTMEALLGQKNIKGGVANTATKSLISLLGNPKKDAQKDLASLFGSKAKAKAIFFDENGVRRQVPQVLASIQQALDTSKAPKWVKGGLAREKLMEHLFGVDAKGNAADIMSALTATLDNGGTAYEDMKAKIIDTTHAQKDFNTLMSSTAAKTEQASAAWETMKIELGTNLLPVMTEIGIELGGILKWTTDFVREHPMVTKVLLGSTLAFGGLAKTVGSTMTIMSGGMKLWTAASDGIDLVKTALKGVGTMLTSTPWGIALTALAALAALGIAAYENWDQTKSTLWEVAMAAAGVAAVPKPGETASDRHHAMTEEKKQVGYDLAAGRITAKDAKDLIGAIDSDYKRREALIKNGFEDPGKLRGGEEPNRVADVNTALQDGLQKVQMSLPPELLAALKGEKVEVTVNGADATVKQGGKTRKAKSVPFGKTVPT